MKALFIFAVASWAACAWGAEFNSSARGTFAADFLNLGAGARAAGMGNAFSAVADDATAPYWNPAAMTQVAKRSISLMYTNYVASTNLGYTGYVHNGDDFGVFGVGLLYFNAGRVIQTDETGSVLGSIFPYDMALYWSYARRIKRFDLMPVFEGFSFGLSAKLVDSRIINSASAGAIDTGVLSPRYWDDKLQLAFTAVSLGGDTMQFEQVKERLPMTFRFGAAYRISGTWLTSLDAILRQTDRPNAAVGTEYWIVDKGAWRLAGRLGFNSQTIGSVDGITGISMGFGLASRGWAMDYGFAPVGGLGQAHRVSLSYNF